MASLAWQGRAFLRGFYTFEKMKFSPYLPNGWLDKNQVAEIPLIEVGAMEVNQLNLGALPFTYTSNVSAGGRSARYLEMEL